MNIPSRPQPRSELMKKTIDFVFDILDQVRENSSPTFTGLGLIFYYSPLHLPIASLGDQSLFNPALPANDIDAIVKVLGGISNVDSPWHDGFHLVDIGARSLTHICQFLAPPLPLLGTPMHGAMPVGARYLAAIAGSRITSVACTALLSSKGGPLVFHAGAPIPRRLT